MTSALILVVSLAGCQKADGTQHLPPAKGSVAPPLPPAPARSVASAETRAANQPLVASGATRARKEAELSSKVAGTLQAVLVNEGDRVKKGQLLFRVDASSAAIELKQAQARVATAKVVLSGAELEYNRTRELAGEKAVSPAALDNARLTAEQARANLLQAEVSVAAAQKSASDTVVHSPIDGVVAQKFKEAGESVAANGAAVLLVQDLGAVEVRVRLPETELRRVRPGDPMAIEIGALGKKYQTTVDRINPSVDDATRTIELIGLLDNADGELKAGLLVQATLGEAALGAASPPGASASAPPVSASASTSASAAPQTQINRAPPKGTPPKKVGAP